MTKQEAFNEINRTQDKYIEELVSLINSPEYENVRAISFTSATGTGKTKMMGKLIDRFPDYYFIVSTLSKGQLHVQVRTSLMNDCHQNNFTVYGSADYKINSKLDADDIIRRIPKNTRCIWLRDEGHIRTNRFDELLLNKCYKVINFSATNSHSDIQCNFTHTMMLRTVNQTNGSPEDAIEKLMEIKKAHKDVPGYNPCAIFRCIGGDEALYRRIVSLCKSHKLKYIDITDESFVMSELCEDNNKYDVIINKFKLVEGIDIRRAHVLYMDNQPKNNTTTIQAIGRCRRNALLYRDDIDIFAKKNETLLKLTRECYVYYNVYKMKISTDADGELQYAFCNYISCESLIPDTTVDVYDGQLLNGLYVIELLGKTGKFNIVKDKESGFNTVEPATDFYNEIIKQVDNNYIYCDRNNKIHIDNVKYLPVHNTDIVFDSDTRKFIEREVKPYYRVNTSIYRSDVPYVFSDDVIELIKNYRTKYTYDYFFDRVKDNCLDQLYKKFSDTSYDIDKLKDYIKKYVKENINIQGEKQFCSIISNIKDYKVRLFSQDYLMHDICTDNELVLLAYFCVKKREERYSLEDLNLYIKKYLHIKREWNEWKYSKESGVVSTFKNTEIRISGKAYYDEMKEYVDRYIKDNYDDANANAFCEVIENISGRKRNNETNADDFFGELRNICDVNELIEIQFGCIKERELYQYNQAKATEKSIEHIKGILDYKYKFIGFKNEESERIAYVILSNGIRRLYKREIPHSEMLKPYTAEVDYPLSLNVRKTDIYNYYNTVDFSLDCIFREIRNRGVYYLSANDAVDAIVNRLSYAERGFDNGYIHRVVYYYESLFEKTTDAEKVLVNNEYIIPKHIVKQSELKRIRQYKAYDKVFNDRESSIVGVDLMRPLNFNSDKYEMTWIESTSVSSKIGNFNKFNSFISQRYSKELEYAKERLVLGENNFDLDKKCNSALGYCVEYYSKYLVYGKSYLADAIKKAQKEARQRSINDYILIRACMLKYRELMMFSYGSGVSKVINTISVEQLIQKKYEYFVNLVVELGTRTADYVKKNLYNNKKAKNDIDPNLTIRHISGLADYITKDTILDVKVRNNIDEKCIRQVLAYHYLSTKRSDLNIKRVIVYDAVRDEAITINISPENLTLIGKEIKLSNTDDKSFYVRKNEKNCTDEEKSKERIIEIRESLSRIGFNVDEDFPDSSYHIYGNYNIDIIKQIIDESIAKGFDISIYKGLSTRIISKVFICIKNGVPEEEAIGYASEFASELDLKEHFEKKRRENFKKKLEIEREKGQIEFEAYKNKLISEMNRMGFDVETDFPDYDHCRGTNYNLDVIKNIVDNSIAKGYNISVYKGLKTRDISKIYICYENGIPEDKVVEYAGEYNNVGDLRMHFMSMKKNANK